MTWFEKGDHRLLYALFIIALAAFVILYFFNHPIAG